MLNNILVARIIFIIFALCLIFLRLGTVKANKKAQKIEGHVYAAWTHKALFFLYFVMFFATVFEFLFIRKSWNLYVAIPGLIICIAGFNARKWATSTLGKYWSNNVEIRKDHPVIKEGPYKYIRHPNYLFLSMEFFGFAMFGNAWWTMILLLFTFVPVIISRIVVEERKMIEQTGDAYLKYKKEVPAFFPFKL